MILVNSDEGGRILNPYLDRIVFGLADIYEECRPKPAGISKNGPFVRFVTGWSEHFGPKELAEKTGTALERFLGRALRRRKAKT